MRKVQAAMPIALEVLPIDVEDSAFEVGGLDEFQMRAEIKAIKAINDRQRAKIMKYQHKERNLNRAH